jgi:hypothetical protein
MFKNGNWKALVVAVVLLVGIAWASTKMQDLIIVNSSGSFYSLADTALGSSPTPICTTTGGVLTNSGCTASQTLARVYFTSCLVGDDGNAGEGCTESNHSWGTTLPSTYYIHCQTSGWPSGPTMANRDGWSINIDSQTTTTFTYTIDNRNDAGRGYATLQITCWATN